jgi:outer membrane protein TolC
MSGMISKLLCYLKSPRQVCAASAGVFALVSGCQSTDMLPSQYQTNARSVYLNPVGTVPDTYTSNGAVIAATRTSSQPAQAIGAFPSGNTVQPLERTTKDVVNSGVAANGAMLASGDSSQIMLDLVSSLHLAGVENPTICLAQERIREATAQQLRARILLVPDINVGGNYHYNNGPVQSSSGQIINVNDQSLYMGFGAGAVGGGSVVYPGMWLSAHLGDAVFEPLAARENVVAQRSNSDAVQNAVMGDVVTAYLRLAGSEARLDVFRKADGEGAEVVRLTKAFSEAGEGRAADADRARAFYSLVERQRRSVEEDVDVASAQLSRLLNLDPSYHLRTRGDTLDVFRLIPEEAEVEELIARAMQARPELVTRAANIREAQVRVRQEKVRPFLPVLSVGVSAAAFGGESNLVPGGFTSLASRTDIDAMAVWNVQNLGFGNRAQVREANAVVGQSLADFNSTRNQIRTEVVDALAEARAAARQLDYARAAAINAKDGFDLDLLRIKSGQGAGRNRPRPIELLDSYNNILNARQDLVAAITRYDIAQFRLFVAVGSNPLAGPDVSQSVPSVISNGAATATPEPVQMQPKSEK